MRRILAASAAAMLLGTGCGGDSTGPDDDLAGTYTLVRANGESLPAQVAVEEDDDFLCTISITGGSLTLRGDRTFQTSLSALVHCTIKSTGDNLSITDTFHGSGTFTQDGNRLTFVDDEGEDTITGVRSGNTITVTAEDDGITLILEFAR